MGILHPLTVPTLHRRLSGAPPQVNVARRSDLGSSADGSPDVGPEASVDVPSPLGHRTAPAFLRPGPPSDTTPMSRDTVHRCPATSSVSALINRDPTALPLPAERSGQAMDAVGHGCSDGERALIASWDHF